jgi:cell division protein ZipA
MDADTLRLILIVVGAALVLALYLWERSRSEDVDDDQLPLPTNKRDPSVGRLDAADEARQTDLALAVNQLKGQRQAEAVARVQAASQRADGIPQAATHLVADASPDLDPDAPGGANTLVLHFGIRSKEGEMAGPDILDVAARCGMRPGEQGAFHRKVAGRELNPQLAATAEDRADEDDGEELRTLFSMVSMVKPGVFPFDAMDDFKTRALLLYAVLRRGPDNLQILDDMIAAARRLAAEFDAEVLDERREPLTPIMVDVLRARVMEFNRTKPGTRL